MPEIKPRPIDASLVRRHAVSQGYVEFVAVPFQTTSLGSNWVEVEEARISVEIDEDCDVLQLVSLTAHLSALSDPNANHLQVRVRRDSTASDILQTAGAHKADDIYDGGCSLPWAWLATSPGSYDFQIDVRLPLGTAALNASISNVMHVLVLLKR